MSVFPDGQEFDGGTITALYAAICSIKFDNEESIRLPWCASLAMVTPTQDGQNLVCQSNIAMWIVQ